jgi:hypothetical protein
MPSDEWVSQCASRVGAAPHPERVVCCTAVPPPEKFCAALEFFDLPTSAGESHMDFEALLRG